MLIRAFGFVLLRSGKLSTAENKVMFASMSVTNSQIAFTDSLKELAAARTEQP